MPFNQQSSVMKHLLLICILALCSSSPALTQQLRNSQNFNNSGHQRTSSRVEALKIAYITKEMNLTESEAQRFWPIYNDYSDELRAARRERRNSGNLDSEEKILNIRKKYESAFTRALDSEKTARFFRAEKDFRKYAIEELRERRSRR
jgi:lipase chaperone LimK